MLHFSETATIRRAWRDRSEPTTIHYLADTGAAWTKLSTNAGEPLHLQLADVLDAATHPYRSTAAELAQVR